MNPTDFAVTNPAVTSTAAIQDYEGEGEREPLDSLAIRLKDKFAINESLRWGKEQEWLRSARQVKGIWDPEILAKLSSARSKEYPKVTRSKCVSIEARIREICFPDTGKSWSLEPSPLSTIPEAALQMVLQEVQEKILRKFQMTRKAAQAQGVDPPQQPPQPTDEEIQRAIQEFARKAGNEMELQIEDQLLDTKYEEKLKDAVHSFVIYGTGVMKGPLVETVDQKRWSSDPRGQYTLGIEKVRRPYLEFVRVWDWYPDMTATEHEESEGDFQRHVMTKHELRKLARRPDFYGKKILDYIAANPDGDASFKDWEMQLQSIGSSDAEVRRGRRYEILEYWGYADARDLAEAGVDVGEGNEDLELACQVWVLGPYAIKAKLTPIYLSNNPFHVAYYEKDESSIFGIGLPYIMRSSQIAIASAARMGLDHAAITAGPNVEVNTDLIAMDQDVESVHPFKIWLRGGIGAESQYPAIRFIDMQSHIQEYMAIIKQFMDFADLETAFPTYMLIEPQRIANETAKGASLRFGTVNITVKDLARNIDSFQSSIIKAMYDWNMEFNPNQAIKGDYDVKAKGLSSLVAKEVRAGALVMLNQSLTPNQWTWIKEKDYMQEIWKVNDLPLSLLRTEEEQREYVQDMNDPRVLELQIQKLAAEVEKMKANAIGQVARAKKTNLEAMQLASGEEKDNA